MTGYSLTRTTQKYREQNYQVFKFLPGGDGIEPHFLAQRISGFGVLNFGSLNPEERKTINFAEAGINSPISLQAIFAFVPSNATSIDDELTFFLSRGDEDLGKITFRWNEMPVQLPPGAIVTPDMSISVEAKRNLTLQNVQIYWQPVYLIHLFNYGEATS